MYNGNGNGNGPSEVEKNETIIVREISRLMFNCLVGCFVAIPNTSFTRYSRLSNRLSNGLSNRFNNRFDNGFDNRLYRVNGALAFSYV